MAYRYPEATIIVFCKAPIAGQVKTRLTPALTEQQALDVHKQLTLRLLRSLDTAKLCPIQLWCSPDEHHPFFSECMSDYPLSLHQQQGEDLGEKMAMALNRALANSTPSLLLGCDCPSLTIDDIEAALQALQQGDDIALAPAEDGGYVMIGMSKSNFTVFSDIEWGTGQVLKQTEQQISKLGLSLYKTEMQWDVDTINDWQRFCDLQ